MAKTIEQSALCFGFYFPSWGFKMHYPCKSAIAGAAFLVTCLALSGLPAKAEVFDFSFSPDAFGTITTGAAAADPGYELITGLTFDLLSGTDTGGNPFSLTNAVASGFEPGAAFNPTTGAFINHYAGNTYDDIGSFDLPGARIEPFSFSAGSNLVDGDVGDERFFIFGRLTITPTITPVPEPQTWAMLILGFGGLGYFAHRRSRKPTFA
jgi:hypothetical protein